MAAASSLSEQLKALKIWGIRSPRFSMLLILLGSSALFYWLWSLEDFIALEANDIHWNQSKYYLRHKNPQYWHRSSKILPQMEANQERMKSLPAAAAGRSCWSTFVKPAAFTSRTAGAHSVSLAHSNNRDYRRGFELWSPSCSPWSGSNQSIDWTSFKG